MCVCVCVRETERGGEGERKGERGKRGERGGQKRERGGERERERETYSAVTQEAILDRPRP